jgi:DeoR family fructose operon transcriptional repressor
VCFCACFFDINSVSYPYTKLKEGDIVLSSERQDKILGMLKQDGIVHSMELMKQFSVSKETVRRDLKELEQQGLLKKVYGGAILDRIDPGTVPFQDRKSRHAAEKQEIAVSAMALVKEGMAVALDASTTDLAIAAQLKASFRNLTILTNSLAIANELSDAQGFRVIVTGGVLHDYEMSVIGDICCSTIRRFHVDIYFLSCNGLSLSSGITDYGESEVDAKHAFMQCAKRIILVCSHDRFEVVSLLNVCTIEEIDGIITDSQLPPQVKELYENNGVHIT